MTMPGPMETHTAPEMAKLADSLWKAQQKLKAAKAKLKPLEDTVSALEVEITTAMIAAKLESVASKNATCSLKRTVFAELFDDKAFFTYVKRKDAWDLVRKQPVVSACRARWDDNLVIPGVRPGTRVDLSVTTRSK